MNTRVPCQPSNGCLFFFLLGWFSTSEVEENVIKPTNVWCSISMVVGFEMIFHAFFRKYRIKWNDTNVIYNEVLWLFCVIFHDFSFHFSSLNSDNLHHLEHAVLWWFCQARSGIDAHAGATRRCVQLATVLLRPLSGHRPTRRQARHAHIPQITWRNHEACGLHGCPRAWSSHSNLDKKESDERDPPQVLAPHAQSGVVDWVRVEQWKK